MSELRSRKNSSFQYGTQSHTAVFHGGIWIEKEQYVMHEETLQAKYSSRSLERSREQLFGIHRKTWTTNGVSRNVCACVHIATCQFRERSHWHLSEGPSRAIHHHLVRLDVCNVNLLCVSLQMADVVLHFRDLLEFAPERSRLWHYNQLTLWLHEHELGSREILVTISSKQWQKILLWEVP